MSNFSMNQGSSHNNPQPPSPHLPRDPNNSNSNSNNHHHHQHHHQHGTTSTQARGLGRRRARNNEALEKKLEQMALPLAPLVQLTSGHVHPAFPPTLLNFWLLTGAQLDEIAHFYHQRTPCQWTRHYPCPITWGEGLTLEEKRRKIGKFIGLRGCETPIIIKTEEQIMEEARRARIRNDGDEALRNKMSWYY